METAVRTDYEKALEAEPQITAVVVEIAEMTGAALVGLEHRLKSRESFMRKRTRNVRSPIRDILRYTFTFGDDTYTEQTLSVIKLLMSKGFETITIKNFWLKQDDPYSGVNTFVKSPDGYVFEIQYHTPQSFEIKDGLMHKLYEDRRIITNYFSVEYIHLTEEMMALSQSIIRPVLKP
jgi:hypothetical protein